MRIAHEHKSNMPKHTEINTLNVSCIYVESCTPDIPAKQQRTPQIFEWIFIGIKLDFMEMVMPLWVW